MGHESLLAQRCPALLLIALRSSYRCSCSSSTLHWGGWEGTGIYNSSLELLADVGDLLLEHFDVALGHSLALHPDAARVRVLLQKLHLLLKLGFELLAPLALH